MSQHSPSSLPPDTTSQLPQEQLSQETQQAVASLAASINFDDPALSISYGAETMNDIARFSDGLLSRVRTKTASSVEETLSSLLGRLQHVDIAGLAGNRPGPLARLPLIGPLLDPSQRAVARFSTLAEQVDGVAASLESTMQGLLVDVEMLEQFYGHNKKFHDELSIAIMAGKQRLEHVRTEDLPALKEQADASGDTMQAQQVRDLAERVNRFDRRLHDLDISRTVTIQTAPQIRLMQSNNQTLAEKIQTSILTTIPIWKSQMVLALSLHGQRSAAQLQKKVADTTNELLAKNAAMLEQATIATATEAERAIVDMETLRETHGRLLSSIEETLRIAREGISKRAEATQELQEMESLLRHRLTDLAAQKEQLVLDAAQQHDETGA